MIFALKSKIFQKVCKKAIKICGIKNQKISQKYNAKSCGSFSADFALSIIDSIYVF